MMRPEPLFIDTWGWLSLYDQREAHHEEVAALYRSRRRERTTMFTTDYVLDETMTLFSKRLSVDVATKRLEEIKASAAKGFLRLIWITAQRFNRTLALRKRYDDKPGISFTDLSSMAVMQEHGLHDVLTGDAHFHHVGLGFRCCP